MSTTIEAFIFDLDGVITDTSEFHFKAWRALAEELGIVIDEEFNEQLKGISRIESLERILKHGDKAGRYTKEEMDILSTKKNNHYKKLIAKITPNNILAGIIPLLEEIKRNSIPIALGSASKNAPFIIHQMKLDHYFDYIVDAGKVMKGKPNPETFITAADFFGIPYTSCIGLEDAVAGVKALKGAGMFAVGIGDEQQLQAADYVVKDTSLLRFEEIVQRYHEKRA